MSVGMPVTSTTQSAPGQSTVTSNLPLILSTLVALVTIIGLFVLMGLHDISAATGIGLVGGLSGVHGGAAIATNAASR